MQFRAMIRFLRYSPFKLRPLVDVVRGKDVESALQWLETYAVKRVIPIKKLIKSAAGNAKNLQNIEPADLKIKDIRIDQGPSYMFYKPGAMGRSESRKKRFSHASVVLEPIAKKEE